MDQTDQGLFGPTNLGSAAVGGVSALFALGVAPPVSHREGLCRVGFGIISMFLATEPIANALFEKPSPTLSLTVALVVGSVIWWFFAAFVILGQRSSATVIRWVVSKVTGLKLDENGNEIKEGK